MHRQGALASKRAAGRVQPFQPLLVSLRGRGEVQTLVAAEPAGPPVSLQGKQLYCGLYLNELLLKLTARADPNPPLFDDYAEALTLLSEESTADRTLRVPPTSRRTDTRSAVGGSRPSSTSPTGVGVSSQEPQAKSSRVETARPMGVRSPTTRAPA